MLRLGWCLHENTQGSCCLNVALPCGLALSATPFSVQSSLRVSKPGMVLEVSVGAQAHLVENEGLVLDSSWEIARREREGERERRTTPCKGDSKILLNDASNNMCRAHLAP